MKIKLLILIVFFISTVFGFTQSIQDTILLDGKQKHLNLKIPEGNEFLLCFMQNYESDENGPNKRDELNLELFITGDFDANVTIEIKGIKYYEQIFVPAKSVKSIKIDPKAQLTSYETIEKGMALHIKSDMPISVYGLSTRHQTTDTYLGLPNNVIGNEYRVMCYQKAGPRMPQFAVVATEDSTAIEIYPSVDTKMNKKADSPFKIFLDKGDAYQVMPGGTRSNNSDLTGTYIKSNKNISVFSGHQCSYVPAPPPDILGCNHLIEQIPPISSWGKHFFIGRFEKRSRYSFRILAHHPHTKVFINSKLRSILQPGQFYEAQADSTIQITADQPILVAQYSQGFKNGDLIGDPMMLLISPTQQFLKQYRFATPINGFWNHFVNVVAPTNAINSMKLDGKKIDSTLFKQIGLSRYSIAHVQVDFGTHYLTGDEPFGMYSYGFGFAEDAYDAYGTMGGQSFIEYVDFPDKLKPMLDIEDDKNGFKMIARDDRINDSGIKSIEALENEGMQIDIEDWDEGTPQVPLSIRTAPGNSNDFARAVILIEDMEGNESVFTICYDPQVDISANKYMITTGINDDCKQTTSYYVGLFAKFSSVFHNASFDQMGDLTSQSEFSNATGFGGLLGIEVSRKLNDKIRLAGRISFDDLAGVISAPDTIIQSVRDPITGGLSDLQEVYDIELDGYYFSLSFLANYHFTKNMYVLGGLNASFALFGEPSLKRRIAYPSNFVYSNESSEKELNDIDIASDFNSFNPSVFAGIGARIKTYRWLDVFSEFNYNYYLNSFNSSGSWNISNASLIVGFKLNSDILF